MSRPTMNLETPPIADPHSSPARLGPPIIRRAKGATFLGLLLLGCLAFACGIGIVVAVIINGVEPVRNHSVRVIDWTAVGGTVFAAFLGVLLCWGGYHLLRLAFGNQARNRSW